MIRKIIYITVLILISVFIIPEAWWARYVPQFWFIPILLLLATEYNQQKWIKIARGLLYLLLIGNICFALLSFPYRVLMTIQLKYQLAQLKASGETIKVKWGNAKSNRIRFMEKQIPFQEQQVDKAKAVEITGSDSEFEMPAYVPDIPKPFLLKWWRDIKPLHK